MQIARPMGHDRFMHNWPNRVLGVMLVVAFLGCSAEPETSEPPPQAVQPAVFAPTTPPQPVAGMDGTQSPVAGPPPAMPPQPMPPATMPEPTTPEPMPPVTMPEPTTPEPTTPEPMTPAPTTPEPTTPVEAGDSVSGIDPAELEMLRQVCLDEINMYRATLSLGPLERASADRELCSDQGAKKDGDAMAAHSSAGRRNPCATGGGGFNPFPGFQGQNTCPGYPVGGFGAATIADALRGCLKQMWDEGIPPQGIDQCLEEYFAGDTACFLAHGHYINMQDDHKGVSCGFYKMSNGRYWMNQDFL